MSNVSSGLKAEDLHASMCTLQNNGMYLVSHWKSTRPGVYISMARDETEGHLEMGFHRGEKHSDPIRCQSRSTTAFGQKIRPDAP